MHLLEMRVWDGGGNNFEVVVYWAYNFDMINDMNRMFSFPQYWFFLCNMRLCFKLLLSIALHSMAVQ